MHDLKYANQIMGALTKHIAGRVRYGAIIVNVRLSPFSHVRPEGLAETFQLLAENEGYANVRLNIKTLDFTMRCKGCGRDSRHAEPVFDCPHCKGQDFDIEKGDEFYVDNIEEK